jgi:competence protein ComEC
LGGLIGILEEVPVGEVWDAWERYPSEQYRRFRTLIAEKGIRRRFLDAGGEKIRVSRTLFEVLQHGPGVRRGASSEVNNDSLVMKISYGETSLLITGDLEAEGESVLLKTRGEELGSTILQVSHHGSASSSSWQFVDGVRPGIAVIQVGDHNPFRFPSKKVLVRYAYFYPQTTLFRTDRDGSIWIRSDGRNVQVRGFPF